MQKKCGNCNTVIEDGNKFCPNCGKRVDGKGSGSAVLIFVSFVIVFVVLVGVAIKYAISENYPNVGGVFQRELRSDDYYAEGSQGLTSYTVVIQPYTNIDECSVECTLYDKYGDAVYVNTITKLDLRKGLSYSFTFDFGVTNMLKAEKVGYKVTGKV